MVNRYTQEETIPRPKSVFACLSEGFDIVARQPTLLFPPLILDVFLWLGPRLALPFNIVQWSDLMGQLGTQDIPLADIQNFWEHYNVFYALSTGPVFGIPSLVARKMPQAAPWPRLVWTLPSDLALLVVYGVLLLLGLALTTGYLYRIVQALKGSRSFPLQAMPPLLQLGVRMIGLAALLLPFIFVGLGITALMSVNSIPSGLGLFLLMALTMVGMYVGLHLILAVPPLFLQGARPLEALREVVLLVQVDFLGVLVLYVLSLTLYEGLNALWMVPAETSWLFLVGLGGHAFVATGLTTTLFVFYLERLAYVRALQQMLAKTNRPVQTWRQS